MTRIRSPNGKRKRENPNNMFLVGAIGTERGEKKMEKMKFDEFAKEVVEKIREYLPETFANARVELQTVLKNNDLRLTGLSIRGAGSNVCPTIYLEQFFDQYQAGQDIRTILENIAHMRVRNDLGERFAVEQVTDFDQVKDRIVPRIIGREWNADLLTYRPYREVADLAVTYHIMLEDDPDRMASIPITNGLMQSWGVNEDRLYQLALKNMLAQYPSTFRAMSSVLGMLFGGPANEENPLIDPTDEVMFVLSNNKGVFGAAALLDQAMMQAIYERFGESFLILPASVHEVLVVLVTPDTEPERLREIVLAVNESDVNPEDRLGERVYRFTPEAGLQVVC